MEGREQILAMMDERRCQIDELAAAYMARDNKPSASWVAECLAAVGVLMECATSVWTRADLLRVLAIAMWQAGYEAAPSLKFVLPEGAQG